MRKKEEMRSADKQKGVVGWKKKKKDPTPETRDVRRYSSYKHIQEV